MTKSLDFTQEFEFQGKEFCVQPATENELEYLRNWKNENRFSFHYQEVISSSQQKAWFEKFVLDKNSQIYILFLQERPVACVGYRYGKTQRDVELFNLICGAPEYQGSGLMKTFFDSTRMALQSKGISQIHLEVLKSNQRGVAWYLRQGFITIREEKTFFEMTLKL